MKLSKNVSAINHWRKQKYRGVFKSLKSGNKTSVGEIILNIRTIASPKVGQDQMSGEAYPFAFFVGQDHKLQLQLLLQIRPVPLQGRLALLPERRSAAPYPPGTIWRNPEVDGKVAYTRERMNKKRICK